MSSKPHVHRGKHQLGSCHCVNSQKNMHRQPIAAPLDGKKARDNRRLEFGQRAPCQQGADGTQRAVCAPETPALMNLRCGDTRRAHGHEAFAAQAGDRSHAARTSLARKHDAQRRSSTGAARSRGAGSELSVPMTLSFISSRMHSSFCMKSTCDKPSPLHCIARFLPRTQLTEWKYTNNHHKNVMVL